LLSAAQQVGAADTSVGWLAGRFLKTPLMQYFHRGSRSIIQFHAMCQLAKASMAQRTSTFSRARKPWYDA
jgi:hypothetical protein